MVHDKYTAKETLERIKLMIDYDMNKTLNENKIILEQDSEKYFGTQMKLFMKNPKYITVNFGSPTKSMDVIKKRAWAFNKSISGLGHKDSDYIISKCFDNLQNAAAFIKIYKDVNGESFWDAITGEWFSSLEERIVTRMIDLVKKWCSSNSGNSFCKVKSKEEMKYGI